jgi:ribosome-associated protein
MRCLIVTRSPNRPPARPGEDAREFAIDAARLAAATRCENVVVLDVRGISPVTDFFVIATGSSGRQMKAVAAEIEELGEPRKFVAFGRNGHEGESWILTDFVDVVLHIFSPTMRSYYDLDGLWGDAPRVEWSEGVKK